MKKRLLLILSLISIISCTKDNNTDDIHEEIELDPIIEFSINPDDEIIPYGSDITLNWTITNSKSATLDEVAIPLIGSKVYSNMTVSKTFNIIATNISKTTKNIKTAKIAAVPVPPLKFDVIFTKFNRYFSTNGSMKHPVDKTNALNIVDKIDITYIYDYDYFLSGFMDPIARTSEYYWNDYYEPWLSGAVETIYYKTNLTIKDFDLAKTDELKINDFFSDTINMAIAPHGIFPTGSCIGGRKTYNPDSELLGRGKVFAFKNKASGKRGLILIHLLQDNGWPLALVSHNTRVQIIREN